MGTVLLAGFLALSLTAPRVPKPEGYLAQPRVGHGPGVLVLHPWWGLNDDVKAFCGRLAGSGYVAFAPDLFEGKTAATPADAEALVKAYEPKQREIQARIRQAGRYLAERTEGRSMAVVGFSFGAYYALWFSNAEPAQVKSVVVFYGTGHPDFRQSKAAYLGHFAEKDEFEPPASVDALGKLLREAGRPATLHTYPGTGHWFFEPSVKSAYDKKASDLAWRRTLRFLQETLPTKAR